ncbi:hypothetical protein E8P82_13135 [Arthrobacter echini]|uniref:Uncharacterized protein n=1 Tax=Arthrobacter echini TaxID=1529066 RepID=A0A4S5E164_9MICC|nr:hypothetical protein [Arthrobacter echini]THJ65067.1 hypothetical protein E8P82_13135 [Arthrobacter echini]
MATRENEYDDHESGLERAADNLTENLADQVPDGVDNGPTDDADEPADPRTRSHSSISEGMNANDDEPPAVLDDDAK